MEPFDLKIGKLTVRVEGDGYYAYGGVHSGVDVRVYRDFGDDWVVRLECRGAYAIEGHADPQEAARLALRAFRKDARNRVANLGATKIAADYKKRADRLRKGRDRDLARANRLRSAAEKRCARALEAFR